MSESFDERQRALLESGTTGQELIAALSALEDERIEAADPIYPDVGDRPLEARETTELAERFRIIRDERLGSLVAPRSALPGDPARLGAALVADGEARTEGLTGAELRAAEREIAEAMVDLQSFRPDDEAALIVADPLAPEAAPALKALMTARAAIIAWIREDPTVVGNLTALGGLDIRIGDARVALDAVNRHRERQAFGLFAMLGIGALIIGVIVLIALWVLNS